MGGPPVKRCQHCGAPAPIGSNPAMVILYAVLAWFGFVIVAGIGVIGYVIGSGGQ